MINLTKGEDVESTITEEVVEDTAQESYGWVPCDSCQTAQAIWKVTETPEISSSVVITRTRWKLDSQVGQMNLWR